MWRKPTSENNVSSSTLHSLFSNISPLNFLPCTGDLSLLHGTRVTSSISNVFVLRGITLHVNTVAVDCHVGSDFFSLALSKFVAAMSKPHGCHEAICKCRFYWSDGLTHGSSAKDASQLVEMTPFVTIGERSVSDGNFGNNCTLTFEFFR